LEIGVVARNLTYFGHIIRKKRIITGMVKGTKGWSYTSDSVVQRRQRMDKSVNRRVAAVDKLKDRAAWSSVVCRAANIRIQHFKRAVN